MVKKAPRPDAHVARLADALRETWVPAMGIEPWLRRRIARFTRLVQNEGWSWDDIGRALTLAGIVYASGNPWKGSLLSRKAARLRKQVRQQRQEADVAPPFPPPLTPLPISAGAVLRSEMIKGEPAADAEVYFAPASLPKRQGAMQQDPMRAVAVPPAPVAPSRTDDEVEAVLRRLRGETDSSTE